MAMNKKFMSVPAHTGTMESANAVLSALTHNFQILAGQRQEQAGALGAGSRYQQGTPPTTGNAGDTWINTNTNVQYYWGANGWSALG